MADFRARGSLLLSFVPSLFRRFRRQPVEDPLYDFASEAETAEAAGDGDGKAARIPRRWELAVVLVILTAVAAAGALGWPMITRTVDEVPVRAASLSVTTTPPGATVLVDGTEHGVTPMTMRVLPGAHTVSVRSGDQERVLTLPLGRVPEAETAEALVVGDPLAPLHATDLSPRIRSMYDAVRARVLPRLIRDRYREGRAAVEAKDASAAAAAFTSAKRLMDEAERAKVADSGLADLRMLVDGFLALSTSQPPASAPVSKPVASTPVSPATPRPPAVRREKAVYTIDDDDVVPPQIVSQPIPVVPDAPRERVLRARRPMIVNVTVDPSGRVRSASIVVSINSIYDRMVMDAAKSWRYQPATRGGVAVAYEKAVAVRIQ